jgi:hypothetical protein
MNNAQTLYSLDSVEFLLLRVSEIATNMGPLISDLILIIL